MTLPLKYNIYSQRVGSTADDDSSRGRAGDWNHKMKRTPNDEESQSLINTLDVAPQQNVNTIVSSALGGSTRPTSINPILLGNMVLRKVFLILTTDDVNETGLGMNGYSPITLMKDALKGTVLGLVAISCLVFLDREFRILWFRL